MLAFIESAKRLEKNKPYLHQRKIKMRGLKSGETSLSFLKKRIPSKDWEAAFSKGELSRNNCPLLPSDILHSSDTLIHTFLENPEPPIPHHIQVIYSDSSILAINKPAGLPVHPCGRYYFHTFTQIAKDAWPDLSLHPVHRLDAETSGLLLLAKNKTAARNLSQQFENQSIQKIYFALVQGSPNWIKQTCATPISNYKGPQGRRFGDKHAGKIASTEFTCLKTSNQHSLIQARPFSGRTNQIRIHLQSLGFPIIGDLIYGSQKESSRLCLHAFKLEFKHPETSETLQLKTSMPDLFLEPFNLS